LFQNLNLPLRRDPPCEVRGHIDHEPDDRLEAELKPFARGCFGHDGTTEKNAGCLFRKTAILRGLKIAAAGKRQCRILAGEF